MTDPQPTENTPAPSPPPPAPAPAPDDLALVRDLALRAHPDAVPELVAGATVADLMASLEPARAAYRRIADAVGQAAAPAAVPLAVPIVPAGAAPFLVADPETLPAAEKIRRGLAGRRR